MNKEKIDLEYYGKYRFGLTTKEIKEYLKNRAGTTKLGNLYIRFCKIAGANTMAVEFGYDETGKNIEIVLMYRHDIQRFTDLMFEGKPTYFD